MHSVILPELGIVVGGLPVDDNCDLGAVDENVTRKEVAMSEVNLCIRRVVEQLLDVLRYTDVKEYATIVVEVLRDALKYVWGVPREGHELFVIRTAGDGSKSPAQIRAHLFENIEKLMS